MTTAMTTAIISLKPASLWRRFAALIYDSLIIFVMMLLISGIVVAARKNQAVPAETLWYQFLLLSIALIYYTYFISYRGQTLGMLAWRLEIYGPQGRITLIKAMCRFFLAVMSLMSLGAGFFWMFFNKKKQTLHDQLLGTAVFQK